MPRPNRPPAWVTRRDRVEIAQELDISERTVRRTYAGVPVSRDSRELIARSAARRRLPLPPAAAPRPTRRA